MTKFERLWVWTGGALFVAALAFTAYRFAISWAVPAGDASGALRGLSALRPGAVLADWLLFSLFAAHHSLFARKNVKALVGGLVPEHLLRSFYVWTASLLLIATLALWMPAGGTVYIVNAWLALPLMAMQAIGVWLTVRAARIIDPLQLAGIHPETSDGLQIVGPYLLVRHPIYLGWALIVFGASHMTADRFTFAVISSIYLIVAIPWEERSLIRAFGAEYERYTQRVRWRMIPYVY